MPEPFDRLFAHLAWADERALATVAAGAPARVATLLAHVLAAEHIWLARLQGTPPAMGVWPAMDLEGMRALAALNADGFRAWLAAADAAALAREVAYVTTTGQPQRTRAGDILLHVALHGAYHRGQVALLAREGGGAPAPTDYIAFVRAAGTA